VLAGVFFAGVLEAELGPVELVGLADLPLPSPLLLLVPLLLEGSDETVSFASVFSGALSDFSVVPGLPSVDPAGLGEP
jgi:hypothetical protein